MLVFVNVFSLVGVVDLVVVIRFVSGVWKDWFVFKVDSM